MYPSSDFSLVGEFNLIYRQFAKDSRKSFRGHMIRNVSWVYVNTHRWQWYDKAFYDVSLTNFLRTVVCTDNQKAPSSKERRSAPCGIGSISGLRLRRAPSVFGLAYCGWE